MLLNLFSICLLINNYWFQVKSEKLEQISGSVASVLVKYPGLQQLAKRAFITYVKSINHQRDKEVFDVSKLPLEEYSASLGLPMKPSISSKSPKMKDKKEAVVRKENEAELIYDVEHGLIKKPDVKLLQRDNESYRTVEEEDDILVPMTSSVELDKSELSVYVTLFYFL